jgi:putative sigma-54 modulation protein
MQVKIQSVHFIADNKLEMFIEDKISKLNNHYDQIIGSDVILRLEKSATRENKIAEIKLKIPGNDLFAKKQSKTFEEATDLAVDALKRQISKRKVR